MIRKILSTLAMCFAPLLYVTVIEPMDFSAPTVANEFFDFETAGYSFRWTSEDVTAYKECKVYEICVFVDIKGPECTDELYLSIAYFDESDNLMTGSRVIIPGEGKDRFDAVEIGSYVDFDFSFYLVDDVWCSAGVPTVLAKV